MHAPTAIGRLANTAKRSKKSVPPACTTASMVYSAAIEIPARVHGSRRKTVSQSKSDPDFVRLAADIVALSMPTSYASATGGKVRPCPQYLLILFGDA